MHSKNRHPRDIAIEEFTYELPEERIAKFPLTNRDESKLLVYRNQKIEESSYQHLAKFLPEKTLLVLNNTKVVEARLRFEKSNGSPIEIFCLEPDAVYPDISSAMLEKGKVFWKCLVGGARKWKEEWIHLTIRKPDNTILIIKARKQEQQADAFLIEMKWDDAALSFAEVLHFAGQIPLPPYLNRAPEESDKERYQTIYARMDGSVAAPTAGLHFTDHLFAQLSEKQIQKEFITLHVGAGTFKPVKSPTMETHEMHAEFLDITDLFLEKLVEQIHQTIIAVGTTSLRTLESLYWLGVKTYRNPACLSADLHISQWEPYELSDEISTETALIALRTWMKANHMKRLITKTQIIIAPGYRFRIIKGLITNFHQPQSTLLLLVAAITGSYWRDIYQYALDHDFRFLSYGDGSLLWLENRYYEIPE